jgi:hypothetical protein
VKSGADFGHLSFFMDFNAAARFWSIFMGLFQYLKAREENSSSVAMVGKCRTGNDRNP